MILRAERAAAPAAAAADHIIYYTIAVQRLYCLLRFRVAIPSGEVSILKFLKESGWESDNMDSAWYPVIFCFYGLYATTIE